MMSTRTMLRSAACLALCLLTLCLPAPTAFAADDPVELLNGLYDLSLGDAVAISGQKIEVGHLAVELKSGTAAPILAGDKPMGLFFEGSGSYVYTSEEPMDQAAFAYMARKVSKLEPAEKGGSISVSDTLSSFAVIGSIELPALSGGGGSELAGGVEKHRKYFDDVW